jgi:hypothetical protein
MEWNHWVGGTVVLLGLLLGLARKTRFKPLSEIVSPALFLVVIIIGLLIGFLA